MAETLMTTYQGRSDVLDAALTNVSSLRNNLLKVDVFYDELKQVVIRESEAYPVRT